MSKLVLTSELTGCILSHNVADSDGFSVDPKGYIYSRSNVSLPDSVEVDVVGNNSSEVHLGLPYYSGLESNEVRALSDAEIEAVAGGEIFISAIVAAIVGTAVGIAAWGVDRDQYPNKYDEYGSLKK